MPFLIFNNWRALEGGNWKGGGEGGGIGRRGGGRGRKFRESLGKDNFFIQELIS